MARDIAGAVVLGGCTTLFVRDFTIGVEFVAWVAFCVTGFLTVFRISVWDFWTLCLRSVTDFGARAKPSIGRDDMELCTTFFVLLGALPITFPVIAS